MSTGSVGRPLGRRRLMGTLLAGAAVAALPRGTVAQDQRPTTVAAASDLQFALTRIAETFSSETGRGSLRLVFGSSGNLARQIRQGASFDIFLSADEEYVLDLARDGHARDEGVLYAVGRIVLMVPSRSSLAADGTLETLRAALADGQLSRFAIANPEHAPYGRRAEEALRHAGLWDAIRPHLVFGENVSQAAQFVASGNAQGGIIAYSLAVAPAVAARGHFDVIPDEWHSPLRQRMVVLRGAGPGAERFQAYMQAPEARAVMRQFGFALPGEPD